MFKKHTLDEDCCLCNRKDSLLININDADKDVKKYIDKLKFVFPDLLLGDTVETKFLNRICIECKDALKKVYKFKVQCKNALLVRRAYFSENDPTADDIEDSKLDLDFLITAPEVLLNTDIPNNFSLQDINKNIDNGSYPLPTITENVVLNHNVLVDHSTVMPDDIKNDSDSDFEEHLYLEPEEDEIENFTIDEIVKKDEDSDSPVEERPENVPQTIVKLKKRVRNTSPVKRNAVIDTTNKFVDYKEKFFMCKICNKQFLNSRTLGAHMKRHSDYKKYECAICGKKQFTLSEHQSHMVLHSTKEPFRCKICFKTFKENSRLSVHMRSHTKERKYMCDICGKKFIYFSNLNCHKLLHSEERKYKCKICGKCFKMQSTLKVHMDAHNNRKFVCEFCKKVFATYAGYYRHKIKHDGQPKFKCEACDKEFYFKSVMNEHMKTHTQEKPFKCDVCWKPFSSKYVLKTHMLTHSGERPFQCTVCNKSFAQSGTLSVHMRLHTGVRPYKCEGCDKGFIKSHHYFNHMRKMHNISICDTTKPMI